MLNPVPETQTTPLFLQRIAITTLICNNKDLMDLVNNLAKQRQRGWSSVLRATIFGGSDAADAADRTGQAKLDAF